MSQCSLQKRFLTTADLVVLSSWDFRRRWIECDSSRHGLWPSGPGFGALVFRGLVKAARVELQGRC